MLALAQTMTLAGVISTAGWILLTVVIIFGACAFLAAVGLTKLLTMPFKWLWHLISGKNRQ